MSDEQKTFLDVVGTAGGKATVATAVPRRKDSMDKIRLKGGPKQYKTGPGPTGKERVERSVNALLKAAFRLTRTATDLETQAWAGRLATALRDFNEWKP